MAYIERPITPTWVLHERKLSMIKNLKSWKNWLSFAFIGALLFGLASCSAGTQNNADQSKQSAQQKADQRVNYDSINDVEGKNYNARQKLADNPNTIIWCSVYPTNPNVKPYTVPIVGKLTSSNKRPYSTSKAVSGYDETYSPEVPGPDGMYGASSQYRYGFDPAGNYWDFSENLEAVCSSVPTVIQKNTTDFAITVKGDITQLSKQANAALAQCHNDDPSKPCTAAANILGISSEGK